MKIRKQVLAPDKLYWARDHKGAPVPFWVSAADIRHYAKVGNEMLAAKLSTPLPLEHQDGSVPLTAAEKRARSVSHNTGWVEGYDVDEKGELWSTLNVERIPGASPDEIESILKSTVKFVSPDIWPSYTDGEGRVWGDGKGVLTHIALTPCPVWAGQIPFGGDVSVAMSLASSPSAAIGFRITTPVRLSLNDLWDPKQRRFAMADAPAKKKNPFADDAADASADSTDPTKDAGSDTGETPPPADAVPPPAETHDYLGEGKRLLMEKVGLNMPSFSTAEKFLEHLCVALNALPDKNEEEAAEKDEPPEKNEMDLANNQPKEEPMQGMTAMSLAAGNAEPLDPKAVKDVLDKAILAMNKTAKENAKLSKENVRLSTKLADGEHAKLTNQIAWLEEVEFIDKATADGYRDTIGAKRLSLVNGHPSTVQVEVAALLKQAQRFQTNGKLLPDRTAQLSLAHEQLPPDEASGKGKIDDRNRQLPMTAEEEAVVNEYTGGRYRAAKTK